MFTIKHKEKRLEYASQYQKKVLKNGDFFFSDEKKIQFRQSTWLSEVLAYKKFS